MTAPLLWDQLRRSQRRSWPVAIAVVLMFGAIAPATLAQAPPQPSSDEEPADPSLTSPFPPPPETRPNPGANNPPLRLDPLLINPPPQFDTYRLGPGDSFFVSVPRYPELSFQATLDIQGNVIVPFEGAVSFHGLTLEESETQIAEIYNKYFFDPAVTLTLVAQRGVEVTLVGEVVRPGYYPLNAPQISAALLSAGGTTEQADLRNIRIQRQLADGTLLEETLDLFTPLNQGQALPDLALQDGDVIVVERLDPGELDEYDRALVARSTLGRPQIIVRVLNYGSGGALGAVTLPGGSRFVDAISIGGVNSDTTNLREIALVRFDEESGQAVTTILDGRAAFSGDPSQNPQLQHNDVIVMNRSLLARLTYGINVFTQPFRDVLGFLLFFDSLSDSASNLFRP